MNNLNLDDALKMIGFQTLELRLKDQEIAALRNTIQVTEAEVVRLRALIPPEPAPAG